MGDGAQPSLFTGAQPCASYCCCVTDDPNLGGTRDPEFGPWLWEQEFGKGPAAWFPSAPRGLTRPEGGFFVARPPHTHLRPRACNFSSTSCWKPLVLGGGSSKGRETAAGWLRAVPWTDSASRLPALLARAVSGPPASRGAERPPSWWKGESGPVTGEMGGEVLGKPSAVAAVASPPVWSVVSPHLQRAF